MFSKACEHGIKAIIYIATQSIEGKRVKIDDIAANSGSPEAFTAKVLGTLTKHNIINSHKGPHGGFDMEVPKMKQIYLGEIVEVIDGDHFFNGCGLGLSDCDDTAPCPVHNDFVKVRDELKKMLTGASIYDLALGIKQGETVLIR